MVGKQVRQVDLPGFILTECGDTKFRIEQLCVCPFTLIISAPSNFFAEAGASTGAVPIPTAVAFSLCFQKVTIVDKRKLMPCDFSGLISILEAVPHKCADTFEIN